jgi:hypothetical protein
MTCMGMVMSRANLGTVLLSRMSVTETVDGTI